LTRTEGYVIFIIIGVTNWESIQSTI